MKKMLNEIKNRTDYKNIEKEFCIGLIVKNSKGPIYTTDRRGPLIHVKKTQGKCEYSCLSALKWRTLLPVIDETRELVMRNGDEEYPSCENAFYVDVEGESLKDEYKRYLKMTNEIKESFDLETTCYSEVMFARQIAFKSLKYISGTDPVMDHEHEVLDECCKGALVSHIKGTFENVHDYDINSFYPWIMSKTDFMFPLTEFYEDEYDNFENYDEETLDLVKCEVLESHPWFKETENNYYDTYQRLQMDELGIEYKIDKKSPKYVYTNCVRSNLLFEDSFDKLYELKAKGNKLAKLTLNCTWGMLSKCASHEKDIEHCDGNETYVGFDTLRNTVKVAPYGKRRMYNTARIKNFLLSYGRLQLIKQLKHIESLGYTIYKVDTDGFISDIPPSELKLGVAMGELKHVKSFKRCVIKNARNCKEE